METEFDNTLRVCDTETLLRLMREGREQQYNRTCPPEMEAELDPQGTHLITLSLLHYSCWGLGWKAHGFIRGM